MSKFYSIPGTSYGGDRPHHVDRPVLGPDGETLYTRKVYEEGFDPGLDSGDGLNFNGAPLRKRHVEYDRKRQTTEVTYSYREEGSNRIKERKVEYDRHTENGGVVLARDKGGV